MFALLSGGRIDRQLIKSHFTIITITVRVKLVIFKCSAKVKSTNQSAVCSFCDAARLGFDLIFKNKLVFSLRVLLQFWVTFIMLPTLSFFYSNKSFQEAVDSQSVPLVSFPGGDTQGVSVASVSTREQHSNSRDGDDDSRNDSHLTFNSEKSRLLFLLLSPFLSNCGGCCCGLGQVAVESRCGFVSACPITVLPAAKRRSLEVFHSLCSTWHSCECVEFMSALKKKKKRYRWFQVPKCKTDGWTDVLY